VAIDGVLARALAKAPEDRYASCRDFADALRAALSLAPPCRDGVISLQADHGQDETTWPSGADAEQAEVVPAVAAAATVSGDQGAGRARAAPSHHKRQRVRLSMMPAALLAAVLSVLGAVAQFHPFRPNVDAPALLPSALPVLKPYYLGVYAPGRPAYRSAADFAEAAGRQPNLVEYVTDWAEPFPASFASRLYKHGATPLVQIEPTNASLDAIAAGDYDIYLRAYANSVRLFGHQVVIGFGNGMNAPWYPWGYSRTPASTFVAAWQHIVTLFRSQGADNVTWLWTIQADEPVTGPLQSWWPGAQYVTWVGINGFYTRPSDTFNSVFVRTIDQVRNFTNRPVLLSDTAVARESDQYASIFNLFSGIARYQMLGLVWLDAGDSRLEGNRRAEAAFRAGTAKIHLIVQR
jgi:hypothetical protein